MYIWLTGPWMQSLTWCKSSTWSIRCTRNIWDLVVVVILQAIPGGVVASGSSSSGALQARQGHWTLLIGRCGLWRKPPRSGRLHRYSWVTGYIWMVNQLKCSYQSTTNYRKEIITTFQNMQSTHFNTIKSWKVRTWKLVTHTLSSSSVIGAQLPQVILQTCIKVVKFKVIKVERLTLTKALFMALLLGSFSHERPGIQMAVWSI